MTVSRAGFRISNVAKLLKLDRRRTVRRSSDRRLSQSHYHHEEIDRRRGSDRRLKTRNPIYVWYQLNKKELPLYLFILLTCILIAALSNFKDVVSRSLYHENITYSSKFPETEDVFANKKTEGYRKETDLEVNYGNKMLLCERKP